MATAKKRPEGAAGPSKQKGAVAAKQVVIPDKHGPPGAKGPLKEPSAPRVNMFIQPPPPTFRGVPNAPKTSVQIEGRVLLRAGDPVSNADMGLGGVKVTLTRLGPLPSSTGIATHLECFTEAGPEAEAGAKRTANAPAKLEPGTYRFPPRDDKSILDNAKYLLTFPKELPETEEGRRHAVPPGYAMKLVDPRAAELEVDLTNLDFRRISPLLYEFQGGRVTGQATPPVGGLPVALVNAATGETTRTMTDVQGRYHIEQLEEGTYYVQLDRFLPNLGLKLVKSDESAFALSAGEIVVRDFEYTETLGTIHGAVFLNLDGSGHRSAGNPGLPKVRVVAVSLGPDKLEYPGISNVSGDYYIDVPPGRYRLEFTSVLSRDEHYLEAFDDDFMLAGNPTPVIAVSNRGQTVEAPAIAYMTEPHLITGRVLLADGHAVAGLRVSLFNEEGTKELAAAVTDKDGRYVFTGFHGKFQVRFPHSPTGSELLSRESIDVEVNSVVTVPDTTYRSGVQIGLGPAAAPSGSVQDAVLDIASYMPTSHETTYPSYGGMPAPRTGGGTSDLQALVDSAMVQVLGRKARDGDANAFRASLDRAFSLEEIDGKKVVKWTARTYAVETELGAALSGAQASIYHLAKQALDDASPLLNGLYPLRPDYDPQNTESARAIVRTEFAELVNELGAEGGPIVQRVDDLFTTLRTHMDVVHQEFGFKSEYVNTVEEEQNLTNFFVVSDYISSLKSTWATQTKDKLSTFLGTQLVLLSRALSTVNESVSEVCLAMDAVALGPAERQSVRITFKPTVDIDGKVEPTLIDENGHSITPPNMVVGELLGWTQRFARDEGPSIIRDAGRMGVKSIRPTAERLRRLVTAAQQANVPHVGFTRNRVQRALTELAGQLEYVARLAKDLEIKQP